MENLGSRVPLSSIALNKENQPPLMKMKTENERYHDSEEKVSQIMCCFAVLQFLSCQMEVSSEASAIARAEKLDSEEPLLMENPRRFVMFPIKHNDIWQFYKKAEGWLV